MRRTTKVADIAAGSLALLTGVEWLGLRVKPEPFPPCPQRTEQLSMAAMPTGLPEPVERHFLGLRRAPEIDTAIVRGLAGFNMKGVRAPMRFESYHVAGQEFWRNMEITWFGTSILRGTDAFLGGKGSMRISELLSTSAEGARMDQGENLALWGRRLHHALRARARLSDSLGGCGHHRRTLDRHFYTTLVLS